MSYPELRKICLNTSEDDVVKELYTPCFSWAERFDRGVGYFTSGWISENIVGLSEFVSNGGHIRLITSPVISDFDSDAIIIANEPSNHEAYSKYIDALKESVNKLKSEMEEDLFNAFSWMLHDGIIEMQFAVPKNKLDDGIFHTKFGIFYNGNDAVAFSGSINDSMHGFKNYEDISVFATWKGTEEYVNAKIKMFERIWGKKDDNLEIYDIPKAIKDQIFVLRTSERPYKTKKPKEDKWSHQDKAVEAFLEKEHGILAMATGTGKTRTSIKIMKRLLQESKIKRIIITMFGTDLLDQWRKQMYEEFADELQIYRHYDSYKEMHKFIIHPDNSMLIVARESNNLSTLLDQLEKSPGDYKNDTLFVFDEVHGAGSSTMVENLTGKISPYKYRLGLSATPEREYDDEGNKFLLDEIGEIIFEFSLEEAIKKGILCPFNYIPLSYYLTDEEKEDKRKIIGRYSVLEKNGEPFDEKQKYMQLAHVNKSAINKIDEFKELIQEKPDVLEKCIIFVETMEYGLKLQNVLIEYNDKYHTYYADDQKSELERFARGEIDCLVTCKKISEGIDIKSVTNIVLFSSDRSRLVTTQRIGRALRFDDSNPEKVANVVDFILDDGSEDFNADDERKEWLIELSKIRRENDEQ